MAISNVVYRHDDLAFWETHLHNVVENSLGISIPSLLKNISENVTVNITLNAYSYTHYASNHLNPF